MEQLRHPTLQLRAPLTLRVEHAGEVVTVGVAMLRLWGEGANLPEALSDFEETLVDLYEGLEEDRDRLGPALQPIWERLQRSIDKRS